MAWNLNFAEEWLTIRLQPHIQLSVTWPESSQGGEDPGRPAAHGSSLVSTYPATAFVIKGVLNSENSIFKDRQPFL